MWKTTPKLLPECIETIQLQQIRDFCTKKKENFLKKQAERSKAHSEKPSNRHSEIKAKDSAQNFDIAVSSIKTNYEVSTSESTPVSKKGCLK